MLKVGIIGAGSASFGRSMIADILQALGGIMVWNVDLLDFNQDLNVWNNLLRIIPSISKRK